MLSQKAHLPTYLHQLNKTQICIVNYAQHTSPPHAVHLSSQDPLYHLFSPHLTIQPSPYITTVQSDEKSESYVHKREESVQKRGEVERVRKRGVAWRKGWRKMVLTVSKHCMSTPLLPHNPTLRLLVIILPPSSLMPLQPVFLQLI